MKLIPVTAAAAAILLGLTACSGSASDTVPDTPEPTETATVDTDSGSDTTATDSDSGTANEESVNLSVDLDPYQVEKLLESATKSIERALSDGYVESYQLPGYDYPEVVLYDPSKPVEEAAALDLGDGLAIPAYLTTAEEAITGLWEIEGEARAMLSMFENGGDDASQYVNIVTNDGFIFIGTSSGLRAHVVTDSDGYIVSYTVNNPEDDRVHEFTYTLTDAQKQTITDAYESMEIIDEF